MDKWDYIWAFESKVALHTASWINLKGGGWLNKVNCKMTCRTTIVMYKLKIYITILYITYESLHM